MSAGTWTFYVAPHVAVHLCHRVSISCSVFVFYVGSVELMFFLQNTHTITVISDICKIQHVTRCKTEPLHKSGAVPIHVPLFTLLQRVNLYT
jgi:hypothetical protein